MGISTLAPLSHNETWTIEAARLAPALPIISIAAASPSVALLDMVFMTFLLGIAAEALSIRAIILLAAAAAILAPDQTALRRTRSAAPMPLSASCQVELAIPNQ
ncbi:hypothetical protein GCM10007881_02410 [Mesorhizobium huakuii]|nr:hypothetical protein GCM10007881_02410 [Mesorhizobium huakuii]